MNPFSNLLSWSWPGGKKFLGASVTLVAGAANCWGCWKVCWNCCCLGAAVGAGAKAAGFLWEASKGLMKGLTIKIGFD